MINLSPNREPSKVLCCVGEVQPCVDLSHQRETLAPALAPCGLFGRQQSFAVCCLTADRCAGFAHCQAAET